jgi:hypothetical protein
VAISLLFTGHMVDKPDRPEPRFPASLEYAARARITKAVVPYAPLRSDEPVRGFASGARGGDILFHEQCRTHGIATMIVLPFPPDNFVHSSVQLDDSNLDPWKVRFWALWEATPVPMREVMDLPQTDDTYAMCNERLIARAREHGKIHLIALWDGKGGDGPGGTADMVAHADAAGKPDVFSPKNLKTKW